LNIADNAGGRICLYSRFGFDAAVDFTSHNGGVYPDLRLDHGFVTDDT